MCIISLVFMGRQNRRMSVSLFAVEWNASDRMGENITGIVRERLHLIFCFHSVPNYI